MAGFTNKEMLIRMMTKLDSIETKLNETHEQGVTTNGTVKLHTKFIFGLGGAITMIGGWIVSIFVWG